VSHKARIGMRQARDPAPPDYLAAFIRPDNCEIAAERDKGEQNLLLKWKSARNINTQDIDLP